MQLVSHNRLADDRHRRLTCEPRGYRYCQEGRSRSGRQGRGFMVTTSPPGESLEQVVSFAEDWVLDEPSSVEI
jgi:hypothetical protein